LEKDIFQNSSLLFNTQQGLLTYDDELNASRADDVESKVLSDRKAGKEESVADCVANAQTSVMHATKLRIKGESEFKRLQLIIENRRLSTLRIRVEEADTTAVEEANITGNSDDTTLNDPATSVPETNNIGQIEEV